MSAVKPPPLLMAALRDRLGVLFWSEFDRLGGPRSRRVVVTLEFNTGELVAMLRLEGAGVGSPATLRFRRLGYIGDERLARGWVGDIAPKMARLAHAWLKRNQGDLDDALAFDGAGA